MVKLNQTIDDRDPTKFESKIQQLETENEKLQVRTFLMNSFLKRSDRRKIAEYWLK